MVIIQEKSRPINGVLLDSKLNISVLGTYSGSIITKVKDRHNSIIFSDSITIMEEKIVISEGLRVGITNMENAFSDKNEFIFTDFSKIHYSTLIDQDIINMYDSERFGTGFPYMISLLNTHLLYNYDKSHPVNHIDFIRSEIIQHSIALTYNDSIIVGDRLVVDRNNNAMFYDSFIIKRNSLSDNDSTISFDISPITFSYEPIFRMNVHFLKYIIILGVEMLR